jgi:two-component system, chemotaxis family, protein-glutamate methylesterase/glutaminase
MAPIHVLIVDDSLVFRSQIKAALADVVGISVVGVASNGKIAIEKLSQLKVDLMTLDLEMAEMNGLETLAEMKRRGIKTKVIIFSSRTQAGADAAILALQSGAADVVAKPSGDNPSLQEAMQSIKADLVPKIRQFIPAQTESALAVAANTSPMNAKDKADNQSNTAPKIETRYQKINVENFKPMAVVIGCSTGGPDALDKLFSQFPQPLRVPIFITQHMPPLFTASLAKRIQNISGIPCAEGQQWEIVVPNRIYIAPGDFHMTLTNQQGQLRIRLDQGPKVQSVRPAVDLLFRSAAEIFGSSCMGIVLTGMGEDGLQGARAIKTAGGAIMIQDSNSSVVFGMPGAIFKAGLFDKMGNLASIKRILEIQTKPSALGVQNSKAA